MDILNKNTTLYILILTSGIVIISSLMKMMLNGKMWIEDKPMGYCVVIEPYSLKVNKDSLNSQQEETVVLGKELFEGNCAQCHSVNKKVVGPALAGVTNRWKSEEQLIEFVKYPEQTMLKNEYAKNLYEEYQQTMPNHDFFDDEQIKAILFYVKYMSGEKVYVEL
ncbi:c-type cytochrome [Bernardetia sp. OM2101]|uniref:c-type cytochrome n=1 Tax=Bernardetia sp. OM2101 TaxID=3344876 RepID=UPI0035D0BF16